jgi:hypothetical protein
MRRLTILLAAIALGFAGCGDDGGGGEAGSPLDEALGYLPEDAPLVITIDTDVDGSQFKALEAIVKKFPFGEQARDELLNQLELGDGSFEEDVKPILGNEFVVGATDVRSIIDDSEDDDFVGALQAKDKGALEKAVQKEGAEKKGEQNGATVYEDGDGDAFAIKDEVLVVAGSRQLLDGALEQRESDGRLTEDTFNEGLEDLPEDALVKAYGDVGALIENDPDTEQARKVEWVAALDTFGLTASVREDRVAVDFNVSTEGDLSDEDLPLASGGDSPGIVQREGEVGVGIRDLNQVFRFGQAAGRAVDPRGFADFETAKKRIEQRFGVSVDDDLFGQLDGDISVAFNVEGGFGARGELKDPAAFRKTLEDLAPVLPSMVEGATGGFGPPRLEKPSGADGLYRLRQPGGETIAFGVVNDVLVVSNNPDRAQELAGADPEQVEGASGALAFRVNAEALADAVLSQLGGLEGLGGRLFTGPLGDITGSIESSGDGLRGSFTLGID